MNVFTVAGIEWYDPRPTPNRLAFNLKQARYCETLSKLGQAWEYHSFGMLRHACQWLFYVSQPERTS